MVEAWGLRIPNCKLRTSNFDIFFVNFPCRRRKKCFEKLSNLQFTQFVVQQLVDVVPHALSGFDVIVYTFLGPVIAK